MSERDAITAVSCLDFSEFKDALQALRAVDDKIIYELNTSVPTTSFSAEVSAAERCRNLYERLTASYARREDVIKRCISETSEKIVDVKKEIGESPNNSTLHKDLRQYQTNLRLMKSELGVEDIVKERSLKAFKEICKAYKPPKKS
ncbi:protein MIX23-like [Corticium candelabrum]|uniref:protein MIX23-like n=1 Tax=Corticium candelabrum TaxID=121492 RepID=UPI002E2704AD|nr:protein MIX23-like [Corticium candelabrum]